MIQRQQYLRHFIGARVTQVSTVFQHIKGRPEGSGVIVVLLALEDRFRIIAMTTEQKMTPGPFSLRVIQPRAGTHRLELENAGPERLSQIDCQLVGNWAFGCDLIASIEPGGKQIVEHAGRSEEDIANKLARLTQEGWDGVSHAIDIFYDRTSAYTERLPDRQVIKVGKDGELHCP